MKTYNKINYAAYYNGVLCAEISVFDTVVSNEMLVFFEQKYSFCSIDKDFE